MRGLSSTGWRSMTDLFDVRFDVPSKCATLLHAGEIDLGMIPSIEYLRGPEALLDRPGSRDYVRRRRRLGRALHARAARADSPHRPRHELAGLRQG